jgi:hypothetical protein
MNPGSHFLRMIRLAHRTLLAQLTRPFSDIYDSRSQNNIDFWMCLSEFTCQCEAARRTRERNLTEYNLDSRVRMDHCPYVLRRDSLDDTVSALAQKFTDRHPHQYIRLDHHDAGRSFFRSVDQNAPLSAFDQHNGERLNVG